MTPSARPDVASAPWGDGALLFDLAERRLHELNASAAAVWSRLGTTDGAAIADELAACFDQPRGSLLADVDAAIGAFERAGLTGTPRPRSVLAPATGSPTGPMLGRFHAGRAVVGVHCVAPDVTTELHRVLAPLRLDEPAPVDVAVGFDSGVDPGWAVDQLVAQLNALAVSQTPDCVGFHAGAVVIGGRTVLIPGVSNSGKSTLTAALVRAGAGYLTDEVALLDPADGTVVPYPKAISLDAGSFPLLPELCPPSAPGFDEHRLVKWHVPMPDVADRARVGAVVLPTAQPGATPALTRVDRREAVDLLLANSFDFAPAGGNGFAALVAIADGVDVYRLTVNDLADAVEAVWSSVGAALPAPTGAGGRGYR